MAPALNAPSIAGIGFAGHKTTSTLIIHTVRRSVCPRCNHAGYSFDIARNEDLHLISPFAIVVRYSTLSRGLLCPPGQIEMLQPFALLPGSTEHDGVGRLQPITSHLSEWRSLTHVTGCRIDEKTDLRLALSETCVWTVNPRMVLNVSRETILT